MTIASLKYIDWKLFIIVWLIIGIGLVTLYSLAINQENPNYTRLIKQFIALVLGLILFFFFLSTNYQFLKAIAPFLYIFGNILLIAVLFFGQTVRGTTGWFSLGFFSFQPVEVMKIILVISLAYFFSRNIHYMNSWHGWIYSFLIILPPIVLSILQPDFGPILIFGLSWLVFAVLIQKNKKILWVFIILAIIFSTVGWQYVLSDLHRDRIMTFLNPDLDPLGQGYNIRQSIIAIGSGMFFGRGLGLGTQSQLKFLPEAATDFIFAVIAEELGLFGITILIVLLFLFFWRLFQAALKAKDDFGQFLVIGFTVILFVQTVINIGMNLGLVPVAGLALPMVSYGGSYLLMVLTVVGIIQSVIIFSKKSI